MQRRQFLAFTATGALSTTLRRWRRPGAGFEAPYLDAHTHVSSARVADLVEAKMGARQLEPVGGDELVRRMDGTGVKQALVHSTAYMMASDVWGADASKEEVHLVRAENDHVAAECRERPERLIPFLSLNPKRDYAIDEVDRCVEEHGMRGLKLHLWNSLVDVRESDQLDRLRAVVAHATDRDLPVLVHAFNGSVRDYGPRDAQILVEEIVRPLEDLRLCWAHLGGAGTFMQPVQAILERLLELIDPDSAVGRRTFVDMSAVLFARPTEMIPVATSPADREAMGFMLTAWGLERVFWGSDNIDGAFEHTRDAWPLSEDDWQVVRKQTAARLTT